MPFLRGPFAIVFDGAHSHKGLTFTLGQLFAPTLQPTVRSDWRRTPYAHAP